ncbi:MAG: hypothetical protein ACTSRA_18470 [Promethearchaeota archaeon]
MNLYALDDLLEIRKSNEDDPTKYVLINDIRFKLVMDEVIRPPIENLDGLVERELIITNNRIFVQKKVKNRLITREIIQSMAVNESESLNDEVFVDSEIETNVEYECIGGLPEGAFMFADYSCFLHINKNGELTQLDLIRPTSTENENDVKPINKEFKNILLKEQENRSWDDLIKKFTLVL